MEANLIYNRFTWLNITKNQNDTYMNCSKGKIYLSADDFTQALLVTNITSGSYGC